MSKAPEPGSVYHKLLLVCFYSLRLPKLFPNEGYVKYRYGFFSFRTLIVKSSSPFLRHKEVSIHMFKISRPSSMVKKEENPRDRLADEV